MGSVTAEILMTLSLCEWVGGLGCKVLFLSHPTIVEVALWLSWGCDNIDDIKFSFLAQNWLQRNHAQKIHLQITKDQRAKQGCPLTGQVNGDIWPFYKKQYLISKDKTNLIKLKAFYFLVL